jgi:Holliday junction resolvase RusA-like endonuclease
MTVKDAMPSVPKQRHAPRRLSKKELLVLSVDPKAKIRRFYTPAKTRQFETRAIWLCKECCKERGLLGDIILEIKVMPFGWEARMYESEKSDLQMGGDVSNIAKSIEDAIQKSGIIRNDKQIIKLIVEKVL